MLAGILLLMLTAIGITVWRTTWASTVDQRLNGAPVGPLIGLLIGIGLIFLFASYHLYTSGMVRPAILYAILGSELLLAVGGACICARLKHG